MAAQSNSALPENTILENYRVAKPIASGGFSIVYLAYDEYGAPVAIKEYIPAGLSLRGRGEVVPTISPEHQNLFRYGMKCFFEEGRALARIAHPNIVRVVNFFRANETVYMVMQYERGRTLQEHILQRKGEIKENFIRHVFVQALNDVIDLDTKRAQALKDHIPAPVLYLVLATALVCLLLALVLAVILDLDRPRRGLIQVSQDSMLGVKASLAKP